MLSDSKNATGIIEFTYTPIEKSAIKIDSLGFNDSSNLFISANIDDVHVTDANGSQITSSTEFTYELTCSKNEFVKLLQKYNITKCYYGHLHGTSHNDAIEGGIDGIQYKLISADYLKFDLINV